MLFHKVLIASDFDGTLVPESKKVTPGVKKAIRYFMNNGGRFTVCTGRTYLGFHEYSPEYINAPVLLANGGMAYDYAQGKVAVFSGIGKEAFPLVRWIRDNLPNLAIEMYPLEKGYAINLTDKSHRHFTSQSIPFVQIEDPAQAELPWAKLMLGGPREDIQRVQAYMDEHCTELIYLTSEGEYLEILRKGVDKGSALLALADYLGIEHRDVYAIGDGPNDLEMLRAAALAFVPKNGCDAAKALADHIVRTNEEDAVAHVIDILEKIYCERRNGG